MDNLLYIAFGVGALWFTFRIVRFVRKRVVLLRERRPRGVQCPACGSGRLDDYSDTDSGMCLACDHVWGVDVPGSK